MPESPKAFSMLYTRHNLRNTQRMNLVEQTMNPKHLLLYFSEQFGRSSDEKKVQVWKWQYFPIGIFRAGACR